MRGTKDPYFDWLCMITENRNYVELARYLHSCEFKAKLPADKNRCMDGMQLRVDFMNIHGEYGSATNRSGCTMLELLISIANRMSFLMHGNQANHRTGYYFFVLIRNLRLERFTDENWFDKGGDFFVEDAVWRIVNREYSYDGSGGLFPLKAPKEDQRCVEIWYQMHAWLSENSDISLDI